MTSILHGWVTKLPLREQGTLLAAVRGCDLTPKFPLESSERQLVAYLRYCILVPADERELDYAGAFMQNEPPISWRASEFGHYPLHWVSHLMHAFEVIGYRHPDRMTAELAYNIYASIVYGLHLNIETKDEMVERLSEDRVAKGSVLQ